MPLQFPPGYYDRTDPSKNYDEHLFRAGYVLQSAELNEVQKAASNRLKGVADALFKDGDIIRDAGILVDASSGMTTCSGGAIYVRGSVRGVAPATITIPTVGTVAVGVRLLESVVTETADVALRDPAQGLRNFSEPGAARLRVDPVWSWDTDPREGPFYPIYFVDDGVVRPKEAPPTIDALAIALAKYDRDSAGGTYVISGLQVTGEANDAEGRQVYLVAEGRARCFGWPIEQKSSRRVKFDADPMIRRINAEPHLASGGASERVNTDRFPIAAIVEVQVVRQKTVELTHGPYLGVSDPLPDTSVLQITEVKQGATTYVLTDDFKLTAGSVDWSPEGDEPATGSTYSVTYQYIATIAPDSPDATGFSVSNAVAGTLILATYDYYVPRVDRLCYDREGMIVWVKGVSSDWYPQPPEITRELLPLAMIYQTWDSRRRIVQDGARMVPMDELAAIQGKLDRLIQLTAEERLRGDANLRDVSLKKSLFVDPFLTDEMRDQGVAQTGAIVDGSLMLPIGLTSTLLPGNVQPAATIGRTFAVALEQVQRTGSEKVNPYVLGFPPPAKATLLPAVDTWTETVVQWTSPITRRIVGQVMNQQQQTVETESVLNVQTTPDARLRQINVQFTLDGFAPGEELVSLLFDGISVAATAN